MTKMFVPEGDIRIEIANYLGIQMPRPGVTRFEGVDLSREVPFLSLGHPQQLDPRMIRRIFAHDVVGTVCRAIADDNPPQRKKRLRDHRLKREVDKLRFIPCRGDEYVARDFCHNGEVRSGVGSRGQVLCGLFCRLQQVPLAFCRFRRDFGSEDPDLLGNSCLLVFRQLREHGQGDDLSGDTRCHGEIFRTVL